MATTHVPKFDVKYHGKEDGNEMAIKSFFAKVERFCASAGLTDDKQQGGIVAMALEGRAMEWLEKIEYTADRQGDDALKADLKSYKTLKEMMIKRFGVKRTGAEIQRAVNDCKQGALTMEAFMDKCERTQQMDDSEWFSAEEKKSTCYEKMRAKVILRLLITGMRPDIREVLTETTDGIKLEAIKVKMLAAEQLSLRNAIAAGKKPSGGTVQQQQVQIKQEVSALDFLQKKKAEKKAKQKAKRQTTKPVMAVTAGSGGGPTRVYGDAPFDCMHCGERGHGWRECKKNSEKKTYTRPPRTDGGGARPKQGAVYEIRTQGGPTTGNNQTRFVTQEQWQQMQREGAPGGAAPVDAVETNIQLPQASGLLWGRQDLDF